MKKSLPCDMNTCFMCQLALPAWKPAISSRKKNYLVKKGEVIFNEGDPVTGVYFVYDGSVKVHKQWGDKDIIIRFATKGKIFGHRALGESESVYPVSATAIEASSICYVDKEFFLSTLRVNHDFAFKLMMFYAEELRESEEKMRNLALMPVKGRLALAISQLQSLFGPDDAGCISIDISRQDLAAFTGASYETVFRTMNEMLQENLIQLSGKKIRILDPAGLQLLSNAN